MQTPNPSLLLGTSLCSLLFLLRAFHSSTSVRSPAAVHSSSPFGPPPRLAYFVTGSAGDASRMLRLLRTIYHPRNQYLLHLDLAAPAAQRRDLALAVRSVDAYVAFRNVNVVERADRVDRDGSTALASMLHGAAVLLRYGANWDWFVNLDASSYPLITQDDLLHMLSFVPRDFNFIEHSSDIGWKEYQRIRPIIMDPSLYLASESEIFYTSEKRDMPSAYRFFTGSSSVILSRKLLEFSILGWDNFPRTLLLYFSNMKSSQNGYFHTLVCNSKPFRRTAVNSNLRFVAWDNPPGDEPRYLNFGDLSRMMRSGAAFARKFREDDPVLDKIDKKILHRYHDRFAPGGWCIGRDGRGRDPCQVWGDPDILRPGLLAKRLEKLLLTVLSNSSFHSNQCVYK
ncbi:beta-glucuronosyltransferase GlcAT14B-like [Nymphaea colorata]|nr:beta-glucuronosyltransferase GlcAT14B-like [Nymphaea colorata]